MISRHGQSDIYDLTFSMGYPVRPAGYMFCYNRSMIHLASGFFRRFFRPRGGRFRLDAGQLLYYGVLTIHEQGQTRCCRAEIRPYCVDPLDHTESMLCGSFLVWLHFCSGKTARHLPTMDFRVIFVFRDADGTRQDETDKKRRKDTLPGVIALVHRWYRTWYQKWTFTGQNSCQRSVRKVSGSCQKSARSRETLL